MSDQLAPGLPPESSRPDPSPRDGDASEPPRSDDTLIGEPLEPMVFVPASAIRGGAVGGDYADFSYPGSLEAREGTNLGHVAGGRYEFHTNIAKGGMGLVMEVHDQVLDRTVAMKQLLRHRLLSPDVVARFVREARINGQLEHPNIVPVYDLGTDPNEPYFTMKVVRGRSLANALRELRDDVIRGHGDGVFPLARRLDIFRKVCDAVAFAHSRRIIHRDVKPSNIMIGEFGEVQLMDWGLAKIVGQDEPTPPRDDLPRAAPSGLKGASNDASEAPPTIQGQVLGTPAYMSPEQARGETGVVGPPADIYALGAVLYHLATLTSPGLGQSPDEIVRRVGEGRILPPSACIQANGLHAAGLRIPRELEAIILKAMARDPGERYPTGTALREEIDRFLDGRIVEASRYTFLARVAKVARRHRTALVWSCVLVLVAAGGLVAARIASQRAAGAQLATTLGELGALLHSAENDLTQAAEMRSAGQFRQALVELVDFERRHDLQTLARSDLVRTHQPGWIERAATLPAAAREMRQATLLEWANTAMASLGSIDDAEVPDQAVVTRANAEYDELLSLATPAEQAKLPVADLHTWLAYRAAAQADAHAARAAGASGDAVTEQLELARAAETEMLNQVTLAWLAQPESHAAGNAVLMLADRACRDMATLADLRRISMQFHRVWRSAAQRVPELAPRTLVGLARVLVAMPSREPTPFAPEVPASTMALRALLGVLAPDGTALPRTEQALRELAPAARDALLAEARDLLAIARHTATVTQTWTISASPLSCEYFVGFEGENLVCLSLEIPAVPSVEPAKVIQVARMDRQSLTALAGVAPEHFNRVFLGETVRPGQVELMMLVNRPDQNPELFLMAGIPHPRIIGRIKGQGDWVLSHANGDFDGDGDEDIAVVFRGHRLNPDADLVEVHMRTGETTFAPLMLAEEEAVLSSANARSWIWYMSAADLDRDGRDELMVARGEWRYFALDVYAFPDGRPTLIGRHPIGDVTFAVDATRDPSLIVALPALSPELRLSWEARGRIVSEDPRLFVVQEGEVRELPQPIHVRGKELYRSGAVASPIDLGGTRRALVEKIELGARRSILYRWLVYDGDLRELPPDAKVSIYHTTQPYRPLPARPEIWVTDQGLGRRLRDADLALIDEEVPTTGPSSAETSTTAALVDLLIAFEHPEAAFKVARDALADTGIDPALRAQLEVRALQALRELRDGALLMRWLEELEPSAASFPVLTEGLTAYLHMSGRLSGLTSVLARWQAAPELTAADRERLTWLDFNLSNSVRDFERTAVVLADGKLTSGDQALSFDQTFVASHEGYAAREPSGAIVLRLEGTAHAEVDENLREFAWSAGDGMDPTWLRSNLPRFGLPFRIGSGSWRVEFDYEIVGMGWSTQFILGVSRLSLHGESPLWCGIHLRLGGGADVDSLRAIGLHYSDLDPTIGRPMRFIAESHPRLGFDRRMLVDGTTNEVIVYEVGPSAQNSVDHRLFTSVMLAGFHAMNDPAFLQVRLLGQRISGDAAWMAVDDPLMKSILGFTPAQIACNLAVAKMLDDDPAGAATAYGEAAALLRAQPAPDDRWQRQLGEHANRLALEGLWCAQLALARADPTQDPVRGFVAALLANPTLHPSDHELVGWCLARPYQTSEEARWRAVGRVILDRHADHPGGASAWVDEVAALASDPETPSDALHDMLVAVRLSLLDDRPLGALERQIAVLEVLDATCGRPTASSSLYFDYWCLDLAHELIDTRIELIPQPLIQRMVQVYRNLYRRTEALALRAHPATGALPAGLEATLRLQERVHEIRVATLATRTRTSRRAFGQATFER